MTMERERGEIHETALDMAKCLMLLSKVGESNEMKSSMNGRMFTCKTCNKQFQSFQALGGHRASHKKPKLMGGDLFKLQTSPPKPKTHECPICGLEFQIGQALGGHMRRHRGAINNGNSTSTVSSSSSDEEPVTLPLLPVPVLKKSNSSKRVVCNLDLNLAPPGNYDDLKLQLGKICAPVI